MRAIQVHAEAYRQPLAVEIRQTDKHVALHALRLRGWARRMRQKQLAQRANGGLIRGLRGWRSLKMVAVRAQDVQTAFEYASGPAAPAANLPPHRRLLQPRAPRPLDTHLHGLPRLPELVSLVRREQRDLVSGSFISLCLRAAGTVLPVRRMPVAGDVADDERGPYGHVSCAFPTTAIIYPAGSLPLLLGEPDRALSSAR